MSSSTRGAPHLAWPSVGRHRVAGCHGGGGGGGRGADRAVRHMAFSERWGKGSLAALRATPWNMRPSKAGVALAVVGLPGPGPERAEPSRGARARAPTTCRGASTSAWRISTGGAAQRAAAVLQPSVREFAGTASHTGPSVTRAWRGRCSRSGIRTLHAHCRCRVSRWPWRRGHRQLKTSRSWMSRSWTRRHRWGHGRFRRQGKAECGAQGGHAIVQVDVVSGTSQGEARVDVAAPVPRVSPSRGSDVRFAPRHGSVKL